MLFDSNAVEYFLALARRGKYPHASSGEERVARILQAISESAGGMDARAVEGAGHFMRLAAADYAIAMSLVDGKDFRVNGPWKVSPAPIEV